MDSERAAIGEKRVAADQWDIDGWQMLASEAQRSPFATAKPVYERLVTQFPPVGKFWKYYAEHLSKEGPDNHDEIRNVYERAVKVAPTSIDLWLSFVSFTSSLARNEPGSKMEAEAIATYERAVAAAGLDLAAIPLWSHYIDFVKNYTTQSDIHRRDALRRVYQRAVRNPMQQVDTLWREYTEFEQKSNNNKDFARGVISENQPKNIDARTEFRARRSRREGLTLHTLPVPPRGRAKETSQAQQWRRFITQERGNPHGLAASELHGRVVHAHECALAPLYRYPDVWIEYLSYVYKALVNNPQLTAQRGGGKEGATNAKDDSPGHKAAVALEPLLERAIKALPDNIALHIHVNWVYVRIGMSAKGVAALDALVKRHPSPLAYIHFMRAVRKADGRDPARKVFSRARKDPKGNDPAVYVAAALMEFTVSRDSKVARNVFEFGLKNHPKSALVAREYVNWLWGLGDLEYTRVILKKVMPNVTGDPQDVRDLWERWIALEESIGDAASVDQVEEMWQESDVSRVNTVVQDVARRSRFLRFEGFGENDLAAISGVRSAGAESSMGGAGLHSGKRDPRTGRRVLSSVSKDGNSSSSVGRRNNNGSSNGNVLKQAKEWIQRLSNSLPVIEAPPPVVEVLFQMLLDTPDEFGDTPAGASGRTTARGKGWADSGVGKKRKSDDVGQSKDGSAPEHDVFRARQAAKQSRMR